MSDSFKYVPKIIGRQHLPVFYDKYYKDDFHFFFFFRLTTGREVTYFSKALSKLGCCPFLWEQQIKSVKQSLLNSLVFPRQHFQQGKGFLEHPLQPGVLFLEVTTESLLQMQMSINTPKVTFVWAKGDLGLLAYLQVHWLYEEALGPWLPIEHLAKLWSDCTAMQAQFIIF